jgi:phospholipid-transporting ATPase
MHSLFKLLFFYLILLAITTLSPVTSILPLVFVVFVTMVKEAAEDIRRYAADNKANAKLVLRLSSNEYSLVKWENLQVGDIIKVNCDEAIPADVVVLYTPLEMGMLNIETTNLDGETNLKTRQALQFEGKNIDFVDDPSSFSAFLTVDKPNANLYTFNGKVSMYGERDVPIDNKNVILRSCSLRNTPYIIGLVVYTGQETKIMMNNSKSPFKRTKLEKLLNIFVFIAFICQILSCLFCMASYTFFVGRTHNHQYLLMDELKFSPRVFLNFLTFLILYQVLLVIHFLFCVCTIKLVVHVTVFMCVFF